MSEVAEQIVSFQAIYRTIKNDFDNQSIDLYLLKKAASDLLYSTSEFKMNDTLTCSRFDKEELVKLLADIKKLICAIEKEIELQIKEEYYSSNENEI